MCLFSLLAIVYCIGLLFIRHWMLQHHTFVTLKIHVCLFVTCHTLDILAEFVCSRHQLLM